jgi:hypothetical protein
MTLSEVENSKASKSMKLVKRIERMAMVTQGRALCNRLTKSGPKFEKH